jgi:transmembrane sensor
MNIRLAYLISKKLSGEITDTEIRELNSCFTAEPGLYETIQLLELAWNNESKKELNEVDVDRLLKKLIREEEEVADKYPEIDKQENPIVQHPAGVFSNRFIRRMVSIAAIFLIGISIWWVLKPNQPTLNPKAESLNQIVTKPGNRTHVILRDGTKVWLNADSKLTYANDFNGRTREVNLSGEAFFDVVSNPDIPFIIHGNKVTLKVTGTSFNVRDYPGELKSETSLMSGKLEVRLNEDPLQVFYLKPNEKITLKSSEVNEVTPLSQRELLKVVKPRLIPEFSSIRIDPESNRPIESAWVNDQLVFSDESFREVADKMEKWYGVKIVFAYEELESLRFGGKFKNENLTEALMALQYASPFQFDVRNETIIITKK